jgi:hypothetical protein
MPLKFKIESLEGLDEGIAAHYEKHTDGAFYLQVEGAVAKAKVDEFRDNNIKLSKELEKFKNIDLNEIENLNNQIEELKNKRTASQAQIDKMVKDGVESQVTEMKNSYEEQIKTLTDNSNVMSRKLESLLIDNKVREAATENGVLSSAIDDVLLRAKSIFKLEDGIAVPYDNEGHVRYGKNGTDPMSVSEWVTGLSKNAPHLFEGSQDGGSQGGSSGGGSANVKPGTALGKISAGLSQRG